MIIIVEGRLTGASRSSLRGTYSPNHFSSQQFYNCNFQLFQFPRSLHNRRWAKETGELLMVRLGTAFRCAKSLATQMSTTRASNSDRAWRSTELLRRCPKNGAGSIGSLLKLIGWLKHVETRLQGNVATPRGHPWPSKPL